MNGEEKNRRKKFFANKLHRQFFTLILISTILPAFIVTILLYYLIFGVTATQFGIPEAIAYNLIPAARKVTGILLTATPVTIIVLMILAHKISHSMIGPFDRIIDELDKRVKGEKRGPLALRKNDKFQPLVDKINQLLDKLDNS